MMEYDHENKCLSLNVESEVKIRVVECTPEGKEVFQPRKLTNDEINWLNQVGEDIAVEKEIAELCKKAVEAIDDSTT